MRGRPPKDPKDRRTEFMLLPMTADEKAVITSAAESKGEKPITWARETLLRAAKRRAK